MAITFSAVAALIGNQGAGASATTGSATLTSGKLYFLDVGSRIAAGSATLPTVSGWTQVATELNSNDSLSRLTRFVKTGDGSTGTHTIDWGGTSQAESGWIGSEWSGCVVATDSTAIRQTVGNSGPINDSPTATLAAFGSANNATLFAAIDPTNSLGVFTLTGGFTSISNAGWDCNMCGEGLAGNSLTTTVGIRYGSWGRWIAMASEIVASVDFPNSPTPSQIYNSAPLSPRSWIWKE